MTSDIILKDDNVLCLEGEIKTSGDRFVFSGTDLMLMHPDRKTNNEKWDRRALVHDDGGSPNGISEDKLTINYANDYPGGVKIEGNISLSGTIKTSGSFWIDGNDLVLCQPTRTQAGTAAARRALVHDYNPKDSLTINYGPDYTGGVKIQGNSTATSIQVNDGIRLHGDKAVTLQGHSATNTIELKGMPSYDGKEAKDAITIETYFATVTARTFCVDLQPGPKNENTTVDFICENISLGFPQGLGYVPTVRGNALSVLPDISLAINHKCAFRKVLIEVGKEGSIEVHGRFSVDDRNLLDEIDALKREIAALKAKVGA